MTEIAAAVDCGSNSTRLLIANDAGEAIDREMVITRLAEGVDSSATLRNEAMERTFEVLRRYRRACDDASVTTGRLVATSAVRDAANGEVFLERAREIVGFDARVIDGAEEAALSYRGALGDLGEVDTPTMIVDVGGGSTELACQLDGVLWSYSMQLGCVRVTERALGHGVVTPEGAAAARAMIEGELDRALAEVPALASVVGRVRLVGLAGTVATLAQLDARLARYDRAVVHRRVLTRTVVQQWRDLLASEMPAQRLEHPGMVRGREDVFVAGLYVLDAVMGRFDADQLVTSESDILDGMVASLLA